MYRCIRVSTSVVIKNKLLKYKKVPGSWTVKKLKNLPSRMCCESVFKRRRFKILWDYLSKEALFKLWCEDTSCKGLKGRQILFNMITIWKYDYLIMTIWKEDKCGCRGRGTGAWKESRDKQEPEYTGLTDHGLESSYWGFENWANWTEIIFEITTVVIVLEEQQDRKQLSQKATRLC